MTVQDNISFCLFGRKLSSEKIKQQIEWVVELLNIEDLLNQKPGNLSGGQQQLVSLARALVRSPSVTLLDEPISHLDTRNRLEISLIIRKIHSELGLTIIYVTHNQEEALALADRIAVMDEGVIQQVDTRQTILNKPSNLFVADFVGDPSMNIIKCHVVKHNGRLSLEAIHNNNVCFPIMPEQASLIKENSIDELFVGIRPIDLRVKKQDESDIIIKGEVKTFESLGEKVIAKIDSGGMQISIDTEPNYVFRTGENVILNVNPNLLHYFDIQTGSRIEF
jgi:multiple sugar transport system ATP-binding protein